MSEATLLPFFAAEYDNRRVCIRRTADYDDTINYIRRAFPSLAQVAANQLSLTHVFPQLGEGSVEIGRDTWKDALPWVKTARIVVSEAPESVASKKRKAATETISVVPSSSSIGPTTAANSATTAEVIGGSTSTQKDNSTANRGNRRFGLRKISRGSPPIFTDSSEEERTSRLRRAGYLPDIDL
ncbi:hypothetical protein ACGC1H_002147 [Rhizoctonia solani]